MANGDVERLIQDLESGLNYEMNEWEINMQSKL